MYRSILTASLALAISALATGHASADAQSCVTINGNKTCMSAQQKIMCNTANGKTVCIVDGKKVDATKGFEQNSTDMNGNMSVQRIGPVDDDDSED